MNTPQHYAVYDKETIQARLDHMHKQKLLPHSMINEMLQLKVEGFQPSVIYDIGSCVLHWTDPMKTYIWPEAKYFCFEAMDEVEELYKREGVEYYLGVLGNVDNKEVDFYQNTFHPGGNSYYRENVSVNKNALDFFPDESKVKKIMMTLDTVCKNKPKPDIVKMDVQGAELDVLRGAHRTISKAQYILLEAQHVDYNKGAPKFDQVRDYMSQLGFELERVVHKTNVDGDYLFKRVV